MTMTPEMNNGHTTTEAPTPSQNTVSHTALVKTLVGDSTDASLGSFAEIAVTHANARMQGVREQVGPAAADSLVRMALGEWLRTTCKNLSRDNDKGLFLAFDSRVMLDGKREIEGALLSLQGIPFRLDLAELVKLANAFSAEVKGINAQMRAHKAAEKAAAAAAKAERKAAREAKKAAAPQA